MKKLLLALVLVPMMGLAEEEWVNGYCWSYTISNGKVEIIPGSHGAKGSVPASAGKSGADVSASSSASTGQTATPSTPRNVIYIPSVLGGSPVTRIGDSAFCNCAWMKDDVVIPDSVTSIGQSAFDSCCEMMSVAIPSSVTEISVNAFFACRKLEKIYVEKGDAARIKTMLRGANVNALTFEEEKIDETAVNRDKVQNEWYSSCTEHTVPSWVRVGDDTVYVDQVSLPYVFPSSGAILNITEGGYRIDLNGILIKRAIQANGDLAIYLKGENFIEAKSTGFADSDAGIDLDGLLSKNRLLIFGAGTLTILAQSVCYGIHASGDISVMMGATVSVFGGVFGIRSWRGNLLLSGSMVGVYGASAQAIECGKNLMVLAAMLSVQSTRLGIYVYGEITVDASIVNVYTPQTSVYCYSGDFHASHSYLSMGATSLNDRMEGRDYYNVLQANVITFDDCIVKAVGFSERQVSRVIDARTVEFGEGKYYLGLKIRFGNDNNKDPSYFGGVNADSVILKGGNVCMCTPGVSAIDASTIDIESGMLEVLDKFDTAEMFKFDAGILAGYTATLGSGVFDASAASVDFYTQFFLDALSTGLMENIEGLALAAVYSGSGHYIQNGGTVLADKTEHGICIWNYAWEYAPIVNGGSCHAKFNFYDSGTYFQTAPRSIVGDAVNQNLKCVEYTVPGASKYDKIAWLGTEALPPYYGTRSLYADEGGKLYFWLPDAWSGLNDKVATVLFDACYGITPEKVRIVSKGRTIGALPTPTREGFTFLGWFTAANGGSEVLTSRMVVGDVTYYAHWAKSVAPYKLTFVANGGTGTSIPPIQMETSRVYKLPKCKLMPPDNKKRFAGWAGSNGRRYDDEMLVFDLAQPGGTVRMTAIWE